MTATDQLSFNTPYGLESFVIQLGRSESTSHRAVRCDDASALGLSAAFTFAGDGSIHQLVVSGPIVHEAENEKLRDLVDSHPDWTREQVMEAFQASGALYGPDKQRALMKELPTSALQILLGNFHVISVDFLVRDEAQMNERLPSAELHWVVKVRAAEQKLRPASYFFIFEPFEGRLSQLGKIGG